MSEVLRALLTFLFTFAAGFLVLALIGAIGLVEWALIFLAASVATAVLTYKRRRNSAGA